MQLLSSHVFYSCTRKSVANRNFSDASWEQNAELRKMIVQRDRAHKSHTNESQFPFKKKIYIYVYKDKELNEIRRKP